MQSLHTFKVRDVRRVHYFTIDNKLVDDYIPSIGVYAYTIYTYLCRCADRNQEAFPKQESMAERIGISRKSVVEGIQKLVSFNMIAVTHVKEEKTGQQLNNIYTLLDRSEWKAVSPTVTRSDVTHSDTATAESRVTQGDTYIYKENNKTHKEKLEIPNNLDTIPHDVITDPLLKKRNEKRARKGSGGVGGPPASTATSYKGFVSREKTTAHGEDVI